MPESTRTECGLGDNATFDQGKVCHTHALDQCQEQKLNLGAQPSGAFRDAAFSEKFLVLYYCHLLPVVGAEVREGALLTNIFSH